MNIGLCPPSVFLRWDRFGNTEDVIRVLEEVASGDRLLPTVTFSEGLEPDLDTEAHIQAAYQSLKEYVSRVIRPNLKSACRTDAVTLEGQKAGEV